MATQFSKDDFVPLAELVQQLSHSCAAAASVFEDLTSDLDATHRLLTYLIEQADNKQSLLQQRCQDRRKDWLHILETLTYALCELQEHLSTYLEVGAEVWLQADDAQRHLNELRSEVMIGYDAVDTFVESLGLSPSGRKDATLGQIEKLLVEGVRREREGIIDYGIMNTFYCGTGFHRINQYLEKEGIDRPELGRHDARIKQLLIWVVENEPKLTEIMMEEKFMNEKMKREVEKSRVASLQAGEEKSRAKKQWEKEIEDIEKVESSRMPRIGFWDPIPGQAELGRETPDLTMEEDVEEKELISEAESARRASIQRTHPYLRRVSLESPSDGDDDFKKKKESKIEKEKDTEDEHMEDEHMEDEHMEDEHMEDEHMEDEHMEDEHMESTTVLVHRHRPSTSSKPSSIATSTPSLVDTDVESEWEFV